jgi:DNA-binding PadR family transcriptional regulator
VERAGTRRRRYYRITAAGTKVLEAQRHGWQEFVRAVSGIVEAKHA